MKLLPLCHRHQQRPRQIPCSWRSARDSADSQRCGRWRASSDSASRTRAFGAGEFVPWELNHAKIWGFYWDWLGKWWSGWWCTFPSEKYELVSWDYEIPNLWKNKIHVPNHQPVIYSNKIDFTGGLSGFLMIFPDKMVKHWENEDSPKWGSPIFRQSQVEIFEIGMIMGLFGKFYGDFSGVHYNKSNHMRCSNKLLVGG